MSNIHVDQSDNRPCFQIIIKLSTCLHPDNDRACQQHLGCRHRFAKHAHSPASERVCLLNFYFIFRLEKIIGIYDDDLVAHSLFR